MKSQKEPMLRSAKTLLDCSIATTDGKDGNLDDLLFDETTWRLHYLIVRTGSWLLGRQALLSFDVLHAVQDDEDILTLSVSSQEIRESPDVDTTLPISREAELLLAKHWMWATPRSGPLSSETAGAITLEASAEGKAMSEKAAESHLRSYKEVKGYTISTPDGELGCLDDLLFDQDGYLRYVIADTRKWFPGKCVLLPMRCIEGIRWSVKSVDAWPSRDLIRDAPEYDPDKPVTPADAEVLQNHFARDCPSSETIPETP